MAGIRLVPRRTRTPLPTARQIARLTGCSMAALAAGAFWAHSISVRPQRSRIAATLAALLIIVGLCGCVVALAQAVARRKWPPGRH
jgi:hypothetical protein